jgi:hypothetical protein
MKCVWKKPAAVSSSPSVDEDDKEQNLCTDKKLV